MKGKMIKISFFVIKTENDFFFKTTTLKKVRYEIIQKLKNEF